VVTLNLTVNPVSVSSISRSICQGSRFVYGTQTLTSAGTYTNTVQSANGCDSVVTLNLTIIPNSASSISRSICQGSSYVFGTQTLRTTGTYNYSFANNNGCDSIVTLNLIVSPLPNTPTISQSNDTLFASSNGNHYQWYRNDTLLISDTLSFYKTNFGVGTYKVVSSLNSCSSPFSSLFIGIRTKVASGLLIYPNPATSHFTIEVINPTTIQILNSLGKVVLSQMVSSTAEINIDSLPSGMYIVYAEGYKTTSLIVSK
jgi:hypothetical protein